MDDFFNDEAEKGFIELLHRALEAKQSDFSFIRSWGERAQAKMVKFSYIVAARLFKKIYKTAYKNYVKNVLFGIQIVNNLIIVKQLKQCAEYYQKEAEIVQDMINEYDEYLLNGHIIDALLGNYRPDEDLWDHRGRGKNGK